MANYYETYLIAPGVSKERPKHCDSYFALFGTKEDLLRSSYVLPEWFPNIDRVIRKNGCCEATAYHLVDGMRITVAYRKARRDYRVVFHLEGAAWEAALARHHAGTSHYMCERSSPAIERAAKSDEFLATFIETMAQYCRQASPRFRSEVERLYARLNAGA